MSREAYWIWLQRGLDFGANTSRVFSKISDIVSFYQNGSEFWLSTEIFTAAQYDRLCAYDIENAEKVVALCKENGWGIITPESEDFPPQLRQIRNCPLVLYYEGDIGIFKNRLSLSFVGARTATSNGIDITSRLTAALAKANIVIVSGGAMGIDAAAHKGALAVNGKTALLLPCGLGVNYLQTNKELRRKVAKSGVVITEYPPNYPVDRTHFYVRNRIISALSEGTAVVEPAEKSGSMLTVNHAFKQGKEVFIIPGNLLENDQTVLSELRSKGAKVVFSPSDFTEPFLDRYSDVVDIEKLDNNISAPVINPLDVPTKKTFLSKLFPDKKNKEKNIVREEIQKHDISDLSENEAAVYNFLKDGAKATDEIIDATALSLPELSPILLKLQLVGIVSKTTDNKYKLK